MLAPAEAQSQETAAVRDTVALAPAAPVSAPVSAPTSPLRNEHGEIARPWHRQPWSIMTRSALLPGWGQWTNGRPWKALGVTAMEVGAGFATYAANQDANDALDRLAAAEGALDDEAAAQATADYDAAYNRRSTWAWILGTTLALSMLDAYVDAHLLQFDVDFGPDPEPLSDLDVAASRTLGGRPDYRVGVHLNFTGP